MKGDGSMLGGKNMANNKRSAEYKVAQVAATLAIENMYMSKQLRNELLLVAQKKKSSKDIIAELNRMYGR